MDILIHLSAMDFKRNLRSMIETKDGPIDKFAPGWRNTVDLNQSEPRIRNKIVDYWYTLVAELGSKASPRVSVVQNSKNSDLYWLIFISESPLAQKFWKAIENISPQKEMFN